MSAYKTLQYDNLIETLQRLQSDLNRFKKAKDPQYAVRFQEYDTKISQYRDMSQGGGGGQFRGTSSTIRELHFAEWKDSDFQLLLEDIGETPVIDDNEWELKFGHETSLLGRLFKKKGRPNRD